MGERGWEERTPLLAASSSQTGSASIPQCHTMFPQHRRWGFRDRQSGLRTHSGAGCKSSGSWTVSTPPLLIQVPPQGLRPWELRPSEEEGPPRRWEGRKEGGKLARLYPRSFYLLPLFPAHHPGAQANHEISEPPLLPQGPSEGTPLAGAAFLQQDPQGGHPLGLLQY